MRAKKWLPKLLRPCTHGSSPKLLLLCARAMQAMVRAERRANDRFLHARWWQRSTSGAEAKAREVLQMWRGKRIRREGKERKNRRRVTNKRWASKTAERLSGHLEQSGQG